MKRNVLSIIVVLALLVWSCSKVDTLPRGVKQNVMNNASEVNTAISKISQTQAFQILSQGVAPVARATDVVTYRDSITLSRIAGIYDYRPDTIILHHHLMFPFRLFKKTGTSNNLIVNLPHKLVFSPRYLHNFIKSDSVLKNDFTITATDYHFYYNWWNSLDYKLTAGLTLNAADLGGLDVSALSTSFHNRSNSSAFTFPGGYKITASWQSGDTAKASFALLKDNNVLLKEITIFTPESGEDNHHERERMYDLTIGNVEIKRGGTLDSIQVFMNGVLQKTAGEIITNTSDSTASIFNHRDILLKFDDGTSAKLSELLSPSIVQLKTLVTSLHDMLFAENVVDYIAFSIYFNSRGDY